MLRATSGHPLRGVFAVPGDKSISHRALIFGGFANGETRISGLLEADDVLHTAKAVAALGADVERTGEGSWRVTGAPWRSPAQPIDCGNSGTGARLLMGAAVGAGVRATFTGDESLRSRPMRRVTEPLRAMGAIVDGGELLPLSVEGPANAGLTFVNLKASAQVKSAILLAGLGTGADVIVDEPAPSRDHTENMLRAFGADVTVEPLGEGWRIRLGQRRTLHAADVAVPGDPSSAAFAWVAALLVPGSDVTTPNVMINPLRTGLLETLTEMGGDISLTNVRESGGEKIADIQVRSSRLRGVTVPAERAPSMIDEYPLLGVAAAYAEGETVMNGLHELRVKESDRFQAIVEGLTACGVAVNGQGEMLKVTGGDGRVRGGGQVATHGDHRIAMAHLVLGMASEQPVVTDRAEMIATSFPGFADTMRAIGADLAAV